MRKETKTTLVTTALRNVYNQRYIAGTRTEAKWHVISLPAAGYAGKGLEEGGPPGGGPRVDRHAWPRGARYTIC